VQYIRPLHHAKTPLDWKESSGKIRGDPWAGAVKRILILAAGFFLARWVGELAKAVAQPQERNWSTRADAFRAASAAAGTVFALVTAAGTAGMKRDALVASVGMAGVACGLATLACSRISSPA